MFIDNSLFIPVCLALKNIQKKIRAHKSHMYTRKISLNNLFSPWYI